MGDLHVAISANNGGPRINRLVKQDMMNRYNILQIAIPRLKIMREEVKLLIPSVEERSRFWRTHLGESEFPQSVVLLLSCSEKCSCRGRIAGESLRP